MGIDGTRRRVVGGLGAIGALAACAGGLGSRDAPTAKGINQISDARALVFDVFGTVVDWRTSIAREAKAALAPKGYDLDWPQFATRWRAGYDPAMAKVRSGERPFVILDTLHREMLEPVLEEFHIEGLSEQDKTSLALAWRRLGARGRSPSCVSVSAARRN